MKKNYVIGKSFVFATLKDKISLRLIEIDFFLKNKFVYFIQALLFPNRKIKAAKKILIFFIGSIGDSICALPAISTIRKNYPDAVIDLLTNHGRENFVSIEELIDKSILNNIYNYLGIGIFTFRKSIKRNKYDLFIELPVSLATISRLIRNMFYVKACGINNAFGWEITSIKLFLKVQEKYLHFIYEGNRLLNILERNGLKSYGLEYPLEIKESDYVKNLFNDIRDQISRIKEKDKIIGMVVGAKRPQNRWPINYFKEVTEYLVKRNYNILLFGGKEDFDLAEQLSGANVFNFCGKLNPIETVLMLNNCQLTISNDTGPMHLSYAIGTPVIGLFSSRDYPGRWYPPENVRNKVFRNFDVPCTMCFSEVCNDNICMKGIKPASLIKCIDDYLIE